MKTKKMVVSAIFSAVTAALAQVAFPLPFSPVPFSLSVLGVFLTGAVLEKKYAIYAQLVYIFMGAMGLPVFAGLKGGLGSLAGPTGGFILAYPFMALAVAWVVEKLGKKNFISYLLGMLAALLVCYFLGAVWLAAQTGMSFGGALAAGVMPFIVPDLIKIGAGASLALAINKYIKASS